MISRFGVFRESGAMSSLEEPVAVLAPRSPILNRRCFGIEISARQIMGHVMVKLYLERLLRCDRALFIIAVPPTGSTFSMSTKVRECLVSVLSSLGASKRSWIHSASSQVDLSRSHLL